jgi:hypothetical protein
MTMSLEQQLADYGEHLQYLVDEIDTPAADALDVRTPSPIRRVHGGWPVAMAAFVLSLLIGAVALAVLTLGDAPPPADEPPTTTLPPITTTLPTELTIVSNVDGVATSSGSACRSKHRRRPAPSSSPASTPRDG